MLSPKYKDGNANEVLPTPGGPTKHSTGPFASGFSFRTARYSIIRLFTFPRPKCALSRRSLAEYSVESTGLIILIFLKANYFFLKKLFFTCQFLTILLS